MIWTLPQRVFIALRNTFKTHFLLLGRYGNSLEVSMNLSKYAGEFMYVSVFVSSIAQ